MRDLRSRFMGFPSVVCVGKETEVSVFAKDNSRRFRSDKQYEMCLLGIGEDQESYHSALVYDYPCRVENGSLLFSAAFDLEQEYENILVSDWDLATQIVNGEAQDLLIDVSAFEKDGEKQIDVVDETENSVGIWNFGASDERGEGQP